MKKKQQRVKKKDDRKRECANLVRVKTLLGMSDAKKIDVLEAGEYSSLQPSTTHLSCSEGKPMLTLPLGCTVVRFLGGDVPKRKGQPTAVLPGRTRKPRAAKVAASRADASQVFEEIGKCMGYTTEGTPKRELLLERGMEFLTFPFESRLADSLGVLTLPPHLPRQLQTRLKNGLQGHSLLAPRGAVDRVDTT